MARINISFPRMIANYWWALRSEAQKDPDTVFSPENIALLLNISIPTVHAIVYPALKEFELIDSNGLLTDRGIRWLDDNEYKEVCLDIAEGIYPIDLFTLVEENGYDPEAIFRWFREKTNLQYYSVQQMADTFTLLNKGEIGHETVAPAKKIVKPAFHHHSPDHEEMPSARDNNSESVEARTVLSSEKPANGLTKRKYFRTPVPSGDDTRVDGAPVKPDESHEVKIQPKTEIPHEAKMPAKADISREVKMPTAADRTVNHLTEVLSFNTPSVSINLKFVMPENASQMLRDKVSSGIQGLFQRAQ